MTNLYYKFKIPDESKPLPGDPPPWGPFHELVDFEPEPPKPEDVVGRTVDEICTHVGTYGMGGPGFFGLRLDREWLVFAVWGASSWIQVNGRIVQDFFWDKNGWPQPWITDEADQLTAFVVGETASSFQVSQHSLKIEVGEFEFAIAESDSQRPILEGSKAPRKFEKEEDLRKAVFLSPTTELWV